ncbi:RrF2 family transcriptional regulator [Clostridium sp. 29_15]|uniref:RrF2 family transcriptional regulator n=1 Tax=Clostridium sp. 29_15 TaxID=1896982 RepID=UPI000960F406|nr:Rrf2 family transcriptional regulator [Clostridium sp. 29_15]OKZ88335.1 MAG: Rrf2 family transcriptional regulator [Clostridium sp. 29_15]
MIISSKGKYGLVALMDICLYSGSEAVTLKSVSKRQNISERYLEQIFSILRKGGIITSKKGAQGGYFLARTAADITVGEILNILEGDLKIVSPSEERNDIECFMQKNIWNNINRQIEEYFNSVTLEALVKDYIEGKIAIMYYI